MSRLGRKRADVRELMFRRSDETTDRLLIAGLLYRFGPTAGGDRTFGLPKFATFRNLGTRFGLRRFEHGALSFRINISAKVALAWGSVRKAMPDGFGDFPGGGSSHLRASRAV